jgi:hypothetical protein
MTAIGSDQQFSGIKGGAVISSSQRLRDFVQQIGIQRAAGVGSVTVGDILRRQRGLGCTRTADQAAKQQAAADAKIKALEEELAALK